VRSKLLIFICGMSFILSVETVFAGILQVDAAVHSDYVWRGLTQTKGKAAVSGGVEYVTGGGWYFGGWVSNTQHEAYDYGSAEVDLYVGMSGQGDSLGYDFGFIDYQYPAYSGQDFTEMYFALMTDRLVFKYSDSADIGTYIELNITYKLAIKKGASATIHVGNYSRNNGPDYVDSSVSLNIKEFSLSFSKANVDTDQDKDLKAFVGWSRSF